MPLAGDSAPIATIQSANRASSNDDGTMAAAFCVRCGRRLDSSACRAWASTSASSISPAARSEQGRNWYGPTVSLISAGEVYNFVEVRDEWANR